MENENEKETGFINVYNFIPFSAKKAPKYIDMDCHTGVVKFEIQTMTPLFIPNTSNAEVYGKDSEDRAFDFFSYANLKDETDFSKKYAPVIPGSEIRGMVRSIYEALTSSCMNVLNMEKRPVKRTGEIFKPGLIRKKGDKYTLVKAEDCIFQKKMGNSKNPQYENTWETTDFKEGQFVYFKKIERSENGTIKPLITELYSAKPYENLDGGYLIKGEKSLTGKKHNAHVFIPLKNSKQDLKEVSSLTQKDVEGLFAVIKAYQEQPQQETNYQEYEQELGKFVGTSSNQEFFPVYYSCIQQGEERLIYLSPASITKEISKHCIADLVSEFTPCNIIKNCCPACDLFGMAGDNHEESQASKIRFSDAYIVENSDMYYNNGNPVELPELASPKLGNTEFYLKRPEGSYFWTYDYYLSGEGQFCFYTPELMGRKFYWNQPNMILPNSVKKTKRNITARLVNRDMVFKGELYFDNISEKQLYQLLWILNCGNRENDETDIVFKLGSGKPLGLGSVKLTVSEVRERNLQIVDDQLVYVDKDVPKYMEILSYEKNDFDIGCKAEFLNMVSYEKLKGYTIAYPITSEQKEEYKDNHFVKEGYKWFGDNRLVYPRIESEIQYENPQKKMAQDRRQNYIVNTLSPSTAITILPYDVINYSDKGEMDDNSVLMGRVEGYSDNSMKVRIVLENGRIYWLHVRCFSKKIGRRVDLKKEFPINSYIYFRDLGKDANGYSQYEFVSSGK